MKNIACAFLFLTVIPFMISAQEEIWFSNDKYDINVETISNGTFKNINFKLDNYTSNEYKVWFPAGSVLINSSKDEQNLVILFDDYIELSPNKIGFNYSARVACANADKKVPKRGRKGWEYTYDEKLANLLSFYVENKELISAWTNPDHHKNIEDQQAFLQMCVWIYTGAEKETIIRFATKYMFDSDREAAEVYINYMYPLIVTFINLYKNY